MRLRAVQVNCVIDGQGLAPDALFEAWPTLPAVAEAVARAGADITVLQASRHRAEFRRGGVHYLFVPERRLGGGSGAGIQPWRLAAALRRLGADVVHFHGLDFPFHARAICNVGPPVLVQDHASRPARRGGPLRGWGYRRVGAAAFTSADQARPFVERGLLPARVPVFAIPESSSSFTPGDRDEARRATGVFGDPALLWVGHLDANKDPLTILRAVAMLLPRMPGLQLWCLFATAPLRPEVERVLAADERLRAHVHLVGRVAHDRVEAFCRACDYFVLGSGREGSGYALIEALACGLTPVVSDIPPFRALTGEGAVGALAPVGDARASAEALAALHASGENRRPAIRAFFDRHLSFDTLGRRLVTAYEALASAR